MLLRDAELTLQPLDADKCGAPDLRIALGQAAAIAPDASSDRAYLSSAGCTSAIIQAMNAATRGLARAARVVTA